jgi:DNA polymerase-1
MTTPLTDLVGFDIETIGKENEYALQPWRVKTKDAAIRSYATVEVTGGNFVRASQLNPTRGQLRKLLVDCAQRKVTVVGWNMAFDVSWLIAYGLYDEVMAVRWMDGMLMRRHLLNSPDESMRKKLGLKAAVAELLPQFAGYEQDVDFNATTPEGVQKLLTYNEDDAAHTVRIAQLLWPQLSDEQRRMLRIECAAIPMVAYANYAGLPINLPYTNEFDLKLEKDADTLFAALRMHDPTITIEQLASPQQLADLLYTRWGLPCPRHTDKGARSTDKVALYALASTDVRAKLVRGWREAVGNRTKYVENVAVSVAYNGDGCIHPNAWMFGTYTGRLTYSSKQGKGVSEVPIGAAIHQFPRKSEYRRQVVAPPGHVLAEFDFSGQEFRWMAVLSGDELMLSLCMPGEDAHSYMGAEIEHCDYRQLIVKVHEGDVTSKRFRQLGKVANLSLQYRTSALKLQEVAAVQHGLPISAPESQHIWSTYRRTYRRVSDYWTGQIRAGESMRYVESVGGRRVQVTDWSRQFRWASESTSINFPIQGTGADQKYLGLACVKPLLVKYGARFAFDLHDGLFFFLPEATAKDAAIAIADTLSNLPYRKAWDVTLPIQFPVEAKLGPSWGELKELQHG